MLTESANEASRELGQIGTRKPFKSQLGEDALMFGYHYHGKTRYYRLHRSNVPLDPTWTAMPGGAARLLYFHLAAVEKWLERPATESEAESYAKGALTQQRTERSVANLGYATAGYFAYRRASIFRFPLYTPPDPILFTNFPSARLPLLQGTAAKMFWHFGVRFPLYAACSLLVSGPLGSFVGGVRAEFVISADPRTRRISTEMSTKIRAKAQRLRGLESGRTQPPNQASQSTTDSSGPLPGTSPSSEPVYREMDRNARSFEEFGRNPNKNAAPMDAGVFTDDQLQFREELRELKEKMTIRPPKKTSEERAPDGPSNPRNNAPGAAFYDDEGFPGDAGAEHSSSNPRGISAWERIRSGDLKQMDQSDPSQPKNSRFGRFGADNERRFPQSPPEASFWGSESRGQDSSETRGDSFSFSKSSEERALAKEQAQKEFDAMVEAERTGGDIQTASGQSGSRPGLWGRRSS